MINSSIYLSSLAAKSSVALQKVADKIIDNVENVEPKIPVDTGNLMQSKKIVKNILPDKSEIYVSYDAPYAVYVHEMVGDNINWSRPGSGPKFLTDKVTARYVDQYMAILAEELYI